MASMNDDGIKCLTKSWKVNSAVAKLLLKLESGIGKFKLAPGCIKLEKIKPNTRDISEADKNQANALKKTLPMAAASPICAIPTTRVEKTSGAIIILIRVKNTSDRIEKFAAQSLV